MFRAHVLVKYWNKYTEMHGQQNVKIMVCVFHIPSFRSTQNRTNIW